MSSLTPISSYEQYSLLLKEARRAAPKGLSNIYLFPGEVKELIAHGRLFCAEAPGLVLLSEEKELYRCYYWIGAEDELIVPRQNKWLVIEEPRRSTDKIDETKNEKLLNAGFSFLRTTLRMSADCTGELPLDGGAGAASLEKVPPEDLYEFMLHYFDVRADFLPPPEDLRSLCKNGMVYGSFDSMGRVDSILIGIKQGSLMELRALAVSESKRGLGQGRLLSARLLGLAKGQGCKSAFLWTAEDNLRAQSVYGSVGFKLDGRCSDLYYMDREDGT